MKSTDGSGIEVVASILSEAARLTGLDVAPGRSRGIAVEALAAGDDLSKATKSALLSLGLDVLPTRLLRCVRGRPLLFDTKDGPAIGVGVGEDAVRVISSQGIEVVSLRQLAANCGSHEDGIDAFALVPRRPLQALAGRSALGRVLALARLERRDLTVVFIFAATIGLFTLATPIAVQALFDVVAFGTLLQPVVVVALLLVLALGTSAVLRMLKALAVEVIARRIFVRTAADFAHRIPLINRTSMPPRRLQQLSTRFLDAAIVEKSVGTILIEGSSAILQIGIGLLLLAFYHPLLLAFDIVILLGIALVVVALGRGGIRTANEESKKKYAIADWLGELAAAPNTFRPSAGIAISDRHTDALIEGWLDARKRQFKVQLRQLGGMIGLQVLGTGALLLIGGALVIERQLTLGQLVAAEVVMTLAVGSLAKIGRLLAKAYDLIASLKKLALVIDLPLDRGGLDRLSAPPQTIEAMGRNVPSGGLAVRGARVDSVLSTVRLSGVPVDRFDPLHLGALVTIGPDDLFEGTVLDNLWASRNDLSRAQAREILRGHGLDLSLETEIGPSGGQLDRETRARLLLCRLAVSRADAFVLNHLLDGLSEETMEIALRVKSARPRAWICLTNRGDVAAHFECVVETVPEVAAA